MPRSEEADLSTNSCSDVTSSVTLGKSIYSKDPGVLIFDVQKLAGVISESLVGFDDMFMASDYFHDRPRALLLPFETRTTPLHAKNGSKIGSVNIFIVEEDVNVLLPSWSLLFTHSSECLSSSVFSIK